jgi:predicted phage terminase large subunit-like protein
VATDAAWVGEPPIRLTRYVRQSPEPPQHAFLFIDHIREALYGGAAGGGKSSALLAAALQYVDVPGYSALLLRRTFRDLNQPDALIPRSKEWLSGTDATWNDNDHRWTFPSGATLTFGYLAHEDDKLQYQGAAFQFVGFDELTQFTETQYTYLFSRCRRPRIPDDASDDQRARLERLSQVPLRVRAASNPGGPGHDWVKARFGIYREDGDPADMPLVCHRPGWPAQRVFIPARLADNPHLDEESYVGNLEELDHHTRRQLLDGDWDSRPPGDLFRREWFEIVDTIPDGCKWLRYWDLAATEPSEANPDPDWTVGLRLGKHPNGTYYVEDVARLRKRPDGVETAARAAAERDGTGTAVWVEQEPGSSGKAIVEHWVRDVLPGRAVKGLRSTGSKFDRARVVSSKAEHGLIKLKRGTWNSAFLNELEAFTETDDHAHDDQVDALSGGYQAHASVGEAESAPIPGRGTREPVVVRGDLVLKGDRYVDKN